MGWWPIGSDGDVIGDDPADSVALALNVLAEQSQQRSGALPSVGDLLGLLATVLREPDLAVLDDAQRVALAGLEATMRSGVTISGNGERWIDAWQIAPIRRACARTLRFYQDAMARPPRLSEVLATWAFVLGSGADDYLAVDPDDALLGIAPQLAPLRPREAFLAPAHREVAVRFLREEVERLALMASDPSTDAGGREIALDMIFRYRLSHLIARYSRGDAIASLGAEFPAIVDALAAYLATPDSYGIALEFYEHYVSCMWLVSLATLLHVDDALFDRLLGLLNQGGRDMLFDRLVAYRRPGGELCPDLLHPLPYTSLAMALSSAEPRRGELLRMFLGQYYPSAAKLSWHDLHLRSSEKFFGYWSFEVAAFVVCEGVEDAAFADDYFYPRDLTGRRMYRTWEDSEQGAADRSAYQRYREEIKG
ncbi:DUF1911 domain-containing protein [Chloroflexia bacterium SDU3-3]|nr:DUF1911 domain-containing protein [Chloroflexia bacterium SDU3-3]